MSVGSLETFDGTDFPSYLERLESYFIANEIGQTAEDADDDVVSAANKRKAAVCISLIGKEAFSTLKDICLPGRPTDLPFQELCNILKAHYSPKVLVVAEAYRFHHCFQQENESVSDYANKLKRLAVHCDFGTFLTRALRDQFVSGVRNIYTKKKLLSEDKTFEAALAIALADETAEKESKSLSGTFSSSLNTPRDRSAHYEQPVNFVKKRFHKYDKSKNTDSVCFRCGACHAAEFCKHKNSTCHYCKKQGHIAKACFKKKSDHDSKKSTHVVTSETAENSLVNGQDTEYLMKIETGLSKGKTASSKLVIPVKFENNIVINMEIDTGSAVTLINEHDFANIFKWNNVKLNPASVVLRGYSGREINCLGEMEMNICINNVSDKILIRIVKGSGPALLGRDALFVVKLPWHDIFYTTKGMNADNIVAKFPDVFCDQLGKLKDVQINLNVNDSNPVFLKARSVPLAMRERIENELDRLLKNDIIEKISYSDWGSPIVPVVKKDGSIRICGDYSATINKESKLEPYPIPTLDNLLLKLSNGKRFTKLDLSQAYHQLELAPESRKFTCVTTHRGLFQYKRLVFGVKSAVTIFQRTMENLLQDLPGCCVYVDDILVTGIDDAEHEENLIRVLKRLQENGITIKREKFDFMLEKVEYLGMIISGTGISPTPKRVNAIKNADCPSNVTELQSFIGGVNFIRKFVKKISDVLAPLYRLLKKDVTWQWTKTENDAFMKIKALITSETTLLHFNENSKTVVETDASSIGVGAVLLQPDDQGDLRPIAYESRTLSSAEKNYSQVEKEGLAVIFAVNKFKTYLLGRHFTLKTDHKPLITLFNEHKPVSQMASSRIKRWSLLLSAYDYTIEFVRGKDNVIADFLSRKPLTGEPSAQEIEEVSVLLTEENSIVNAAVVEKETENDYILKQVLKHTKTGWYEKPNDSNLLTYYNKRNELSVEDNILLWNDRVVVPSSLRHFLLNDLHSEHLGMVKMKQLARRYIWWPKLDMDIEMKVKSCTHCQEFAKLPPSSKPSSWSWPAGPWHRLHLDFAGPFLGQMFLVIVDAFSKYLDVIPMKTANAENTICAVRKLFSVFGLPEHIVTDNGSQFTSIEFKDFLRRNDVIHTLTAPGHPATNGLAERFVGHFKTSLKKIGLTGESLQAKLDRFLLTYRATPNNFGKSPNELLMNRQPRIRLAALRNSTTKKQVVIFKENFGGNCKYHPGQKVFVFNYGKGLRWLPGKIITVISPRSYQVQVNNSLFKRHEEQMRPRYTDNVLNQNIDLPPLPSLENLDFLRQPPNILLPPPPDDSRSVPYTEDSELLSVPEPQASCSNDKVATRKNPARNRKPPKSLQDYVC